ncbi:serine/threonine-protein kinase [Caldimonas sp. KR1-144]|uniref:serine/threonine-protein kinase n=1 Tax=Caldimonas sp. KR1-144 TaxID=3400911 RepID=UPI003C039D74
MTSSPNGTSAVHRLSRLRSALRNRLLRRRGPSDSALSTIGLTQAASTVSDTVALDDAPGAERLGRYTLRGRIGEGGIGSVYAADDPLLSRRVAIKTLNLRDPSAGEAPSSMTSRDALHQLFLNEARAAARLSHPNIVTVFDAGIRPEGAYIAMELLHGKDLRQRLAEGWRPTPGEAALIVRRVADALAYAHSKRVIHRDIKPANIFMVGRTTPKVLDFGIARIVRARRDGARQQQDSQAGSPHYMAPEQIEGAETDARTDVFALGAVLWELLTGRKAFPGKSLEEIGQAVLATPPRPAHEVVSSVPSALAAIANQALARDPASRHASARALARELREWLREHPESLAVGDDDPAPRRLQRVVLAGVASLGLLIAAVGAWQMLSPHDEAFAPQASAAAVARTPAAPAVAAPVPTPEPPPGTAPQAAPEPAAPAVAAAVAAPPAAAERGVVQIAVAPWAEVVVNGKPHGIAPPLTRLELPAGRYEIMLRNSGFAPHRVVVEVGGDEPVLVKHRFGS